MREVCIPARMMPQKSGVVSECAKKLRPSFGGSSAAHEPVWDGEGWGYDRAVGSNLFKYSWVSMTFRSCSKSQRELAVATAGRESPSDTHMFGSVCDCRFTKR